MFTITYISLKTPQNIKFNKFFRKMNKVFEKTLKQSILFILDYY